jgi:hypothetical protein
MIRSNSKQSSQGSNEWLSYLSLTTVPTMKYSANGGEVMIEDPELVTATKKPKKYYFDGFCEETNTVYEYLGDFVHGNLKQSNSELYQRKNIATFERINRIKELGFDVIIMWQSDWLKSIERIQYFILFE